MKRKTDQQKHNTDKQDPTLVNALCDSVSVGGGAPVED